MCKSPPAQAGGGLHFETLPSSGNYQEYALSGALKHRVTHNQQALRPLDEVFAALQSSAFRRKFHLGPVERDYLAKHGLREVLIQAEEFIARRLAPAHPRNDGKQTPWRGHPVFVAQHATGTCCRGCLAEWHHIARGAELTDEQQAHVIATIERWLRSEQAS